MEVGASDTFRVHIEAFPPAAHRQFRSVMMESIHSYVGLHRYIHSRVPVYTTSRSSSSFQSARTAPRYCVS